MRDLLLLNLQTNYTTGQLLMSTLIELIGEIESAGWPPTDPKTLRPRGRVFAQTGEEDASPDDGSTSEFDYELCGFMELYPLDPRRGGFMELYPPDPCKWSLLIRIKADLTIAWAAAFNSSEKGSGGTLKSPGTLAEMLSWAEHDISSIPAYTPRVLLAITAGAKCIGEDPEDKRYWEFSCSMDQMRQICKILNKDRYIAEFEAWHVGRSSPIDLRRLQARVAQMKADQSDGDGES